MIKFLLEKEQVFFTEIDSYLSLHDYAADALGCQFGD